MLAGLALGFVTWCALLALQIGVPTVSSHWDADALTRKAQLAARRDGPRLLVLSGSSGRYGINCGILETRTGMPCTNLAVHAGLRLRYTINYAEHIARAGDVLLIAFEYQVYGEDGEYDPIMVDYVMAHDPAYLRTLSPLALARFALSVDGARLVQGLTSRVVPPLAAAETAAENAAADTANPFSLDGDELHNHAAERTPDMIATVAQTVPIHTLLADGAPTGYARATLASLAAWCRAHGVTLWATYPATERFAAYNAPVARATLARVNAMYAALGVPVLERPDDLLWPANAFFNTAYHPTTEAAAIRSRALAERACALLIASPAAPRCRS
jgi:hypothetical protein